MTTTRILAIKPKKILVIHKDLIVYFTTIHLKVLQRIVGVICHNFFAEKFQVSFNLNRLLCTKISVDLCIYTQSL
jgi:hypothetical protein